MLVSTAGPSLNTLEEGRGMLDYYERHLLADAVLETAR